MYYHVKVKVVDPFGKIFYHTHFVSDINYSPEEKALERSRFHCFGMRINSYKFEVVEKMPWEEYNRKQQGS